MTLFDLILGPFLGLLTGLFFGIPLGMKLKADQVAREKRMIEAAVQKALADKKPDQQ